MLKWIVVQFDSLMRYMYWRTAQIPANTTTVFTLQQQWKEEQEREINSFSDSESQPPWASNPTLPHCRQQSHSSTITQFCSLTNRAVFFLFLSFRKYNVKLSEEELHFTPQYSLHFSSQGTAAICELTKVVFETISLKAAKLLPLIPSFYFNIYNSRQFKSQEDWQQ